MTRPTLPAHRRLGLPPVLGASLLIALALVIVAGLLAGPAAAKPRGDASSPDVTVIVRTDDDPVADPGSAVDDPAPLAADPGSAGEPQVAVDDPVVPIGTTATPPPGSAATPVAVPPVSPVPTVGPPLEAVDDPVADPGGPTGTGDLLFASETCDPIVPGQIDDRFCAPAPPDGYVARVYLHPAENDWTLYYEGTLPVDLLDVPAGRYQLGGGPLPAGKQLTLVCRVEDQAGNLLETVRGNGYSGMVTISIGDERVYRCTMYTLPAGELPTENAPDIDPTGPVDLIITDYLCPAGTDPALNWYGLSGRCPQSQSNPRWEARRAGLYESAEQIDDGVAAMTLPSGTWTVSTVWPTGDYPPTLFCKAYDADTFQPLSQYQPFVTFQHGQTGAVMQLPPNTIWRCAAYFVPASTGTGADTVQLATTVHACPAGTAAPTVAACAVTLPGATVHLLFGTEFVVGTRQTDAAGVAAFAAPANLGIYGLAEEAPAGYAQAADAVCSTNGGAPSAYAVSAAGVVDLGELAGGDAVACDWFNVADPGATPVALDLEAADIADLIPVDGGGTVGRPVATPVVDPEDASEGGDGEGDAGRDEPVVDGGEEDADATATPEPGIVPLEDGA